jgi:hypothetical protein
VAPGDGTVVAHHDLERCVSFDVFLMRFDRGDAVELDAPRILELLEPAIVEREGSFARLRTTDGEADVYGLDSTGSLMVNHASGAAIWDLLVDVARAGQLAIIPGGCATCIVEEEQRADLPEGVPEPVEVIASGSELRLLIEDSLE